MTIRAQWLSNGRYAVMVTSSGGGQSRWNDLAITRWREDPTGDPWGSHVLLRDAETGAVWSAGERAAGPAADTYAATLSDGVATFARRDGTLSTRLDVAVDRDRDAELRWLTITNHGASPRVLSVTSYAELVLGAAAPDAAHPAFSKMFVQTEVEPEGIVLATRRRQTPAEPEVWAAHLAVSSEREPRGFELETSRAAFLGRGRTLHDAAAMAGHALTNTVGTVLDPIFSVREHVRIPPGESAQVAFWTVVAGSRAAALEIARAVREAESGRTISRAVEHAATVRAAFGIDAAEGERTTALLGPLLYADASLRAPPAVLARASGGAPVLWAHGISGDRPIALVRSAGRGALGRVDELLRAQRWWHARGLGVDLVVLDTSRDDVQHAAIAAVFRAHQTRLAADPDGTAAAAFLLRDDQLDGAHRDGVAAAARLVIDADQPPAPRADRVSEAVELWPVHPATTTARARRERAKLELDNGIGGFDAGAREYVITLAGGRSTPLPWINVIANPAFGFLVSAEGGGYTWSLDSQQDPLTPWPNDPVSDAPHEVLYLRDADTNTVWSATAAPMPVSGTTYTTAHGKGYTRFTHEAHGIEVELVQLVALADPVKLSRLTLRNRSGRTRRLQLTAYVEWALGPIGTVPQPFVVTSLDPSSGALFARNAWRAEYGERVAFLDLGGAQQAYTADRGEVLGREGAVDRPAALLAARPLSGRSGAGLDPCGALQTEIELATDREVELVVVLGDAASTAEAGRLVARYRTADVDAVLAEVRAQWDDVLGAIQVTTPERSMDLLLGDWLLYQTLACRLWARTAYYQASGAYGFRDQLQDVMALCIARPDLAREHLLRAAARQFVRGDVQHWWLPPAGQGVRTHVTDDRIWLAYCTAHYLEVTADLAVLDASVAFLDGAELAADKHDAFFLPTTSREQASLYEHCARAIDVSLTLGAHELPLMGAGDWNDGMNRVGELGRGESVWLAWFLVATIDALAPHGARRGDHERVARWRQVATTVRAAAEREAWDGEWYRRGYYDDGTPLGSHASAECQIDAIAQSWSVIAGATDRDRASRAMASVDRRLIDHAANIAPLFTPPFDRTPLEPGYIKAYPPGIRENGGQYTHGAIWSIFAFAALGDGNRAGALFAILDPIHHSSTPEAVARYQVEPYVSCADVYSVAPHVGRGGWTWYSGSAGWLYRAGLEAILGVRVQGDVLAIDPCIPDAWPGYQVSLRHRGADRRVTRYEIEVQNPHHVSRGVAAVELDGTALPAVARIPLVDDGAIHRVRVVLGASAAP
ncbi:MAG: glycosyl transferase family 36 [Kofleriaceae bacterium]